MYYLVYKWDGVLKLSFKYSNFSISGVKIIGQLYGGGKKFYPTLCIKINFKIIKNLVVKHETKKYKQNTIINTVFFLEKFFLYMTSKAEIMKDNIGKLKSSIIKNTAKRQKQKIRKKIIQFKIT